MASENETVADIVKRVRRDCNSYPLPTAATEMLKLVREIESAHEREVAELREFAKFAEEWYCGCTCKTTYEEREYGCCNQCEFGEKLRKVLEGGIK